MENLKIPDVLGVWKKLQMTIFNIPNNLFFVKYALGIVPGLADAGVPQGGGDGFWTSARCIEGSGKNLLTTICNILNQSQAQ